jgi:MFS family permease
MNAASADFPSAIMGIVLASYFGGYTVGAVALGSLLMRVGHIRLFAALAGVVAASIAMLPVFPSPQAWILFRFITGMGCAGLFIIAESWLNGSSDAGNRGTIFAIYLVSTNAAFGGGQFLLNVPFTGTFQLFCLAAALFCVALVPVSLTRATPPTLAVLPHLTLRDLRRLAPVALSGTPASGLASSSFYALVPAYAQSQGIPASSIALYIPTAIFGGLVFQLPIGRLSDRLDRRVLAAIVATCLCVTALALALAPFPRSAKFAVTFILGGFLTTIYPLPSVRCACERSRGPREGSGSQWSAHPY